MSLIQKPGICKSWFKRSGVIFRVSEVRILQVIDDEARPQSDGSNPT